MTAPMGSGPVGGALVGTARLVRLALRRDRVVLPAWLAAIAALTAGIATSVVGLYTTEAERAAAATFSAGNPITRAFDGPASGTDPGALVLMEGYWLIAVLVGLLCGQAVVRHTRAEEESGRAELVGAAVVGRHAPLAAAVVVGAVAAAGAGAVSTGVWLAVGLAATGSVLAGLTLTGVGLVLTGVAAVAAQVVEGARAANAATGAVVGAAFLLRAVGDAAGEAVGDGTVVRSAWPSWLSPIGWGQQARAFDADRWWVLALFAATAVLLVAAAAVLVARRDLGAGLVAPRPGPATAPRGLGTPVGLAWRLQRTALLGWAIGVAAIGAAFGAVGHHAEEVLAVSEDFAEAIAALGAGEPVELFFAFAVGLLAMAPAAAGIQAVLRLAAEERSGRAEGVLAAGVSRTAWVAAVLAVAVGGVVGLLSLLGVAGAVGFTAAGGSWAVGWSGMAGAAMAQVPAALVLCGVALLAVALAPGAAPAIGWSVLAGAVVAGQLGSLLGLPQPVLNLSPSTHVPAVPVEPLAATPLVALAAVAVLLAATAVTRLRTRDLHLPV